MEDFLDFAAEVLGAERGSLVPETAYESIDEWDSIAHLRLVMETEAKYGISIPIDVVPQLKTLADFHALTVSGS